MSKKLLTEDLILKKLFEKGIKEPGTFDTEDVLDDLLEYYDSELRSDWGSANMYFTTMSTADGYELWLATEDEERPYFEQDVYYYESDWLEKLPQAIFDGLTIHLDEYHRDDYAFEDAINEVYDAYWNDQKQEIENELIDEGYEWDKDEE